MSYARLILSASSKEPMPAGLTKKLPPRYAATPLIQQYVNNIFTLLPIFEETTLYACVDAVYHLEGVAKPFDIWIVRMVLAIACLSQSEQRGDTLYSDAVGHVNAALEQAEKVLHPGFISSIQALVLLVIYATMDPHHFDSWTLIGAASRAMVDLGIHQDPSKSSPVARPKLEIRRRVYWCVYSLDRCVGVDSLVAVVALLMLPGRLRWCRLAPSLFRMIPHTCTFRSTARPRHPDTPLRRTMSSCKPSTPPSTSSRSARSSPNGTWTCSSLAASHGTTRTHTYGRCTTR
jgi:hypothetical protein